MEERERSSTGLEENVAGLLCYFLGFVTGILFLIWEKKSRFVRFHARQSTIAFLGLFVILILVGWIPLFGMLVWIGTLVIWLLLMVKALQGKRYGLPIVGPLAEEKDDAAQEKR